MIKKFQNSDKYTKYSIIIIILFSIIVLSLTLIYHVSGDGCWYIPVSKFIAEHKKFPLHEPLGRDEPFWSPPLYHILAAAVYYIFNQFNHDLANFAVKFISPIFGILALILSYLVIKKLTSSKTAFYSIIFLSFIPIFIDYSTIAYVESMLVFFTVLSIYFLLKDKIILAGAAAGLSILTKYNGVFILPILAFILYKKYNRNMREFYKKMIVITIIAFLIPAPWFIRNWILLGNPIWPFLNFIFQGYEQKSYSGFDFSGLMHYNIIVSTYLGFFGVPDGNYNIFTFFDFPLFKFLFTIWIIGTIVFMIPFIFGIIERKRFAKIKSLVYLWFIVYFLLFLVYVANVGFGVSRIILPAFPAIAVVWAYGLEKLESKKVFRFLLTLVIIGLALSLFAKYAYSSISWYKYQNDFNWVRYNTPINSVFIANGQCIPYNIERTSLYATSQNIQKAGYIWINQDFRLDRRSVYNDEELKLLKQNGLVYSNNQTGTEIYKIKR